MLPDIEIINSNDVVIAISQSGETADTMAAIKLAKENGAFVFGVCNVVGSSIREKLMQVPIHCRSRNRCCIYLKPLQLKLQC
jgi:glucosamine 6-phosphate synthetase-like amidotransferase/phosphosugar isomerase protein